MLVDILGYGCGLHRFRAYVGEILEMKGLFQE